MPRPALRERLGRAANHRVHAFYTWDLAASRLVETYSAAVRHTQPEEVAS